MTEPKRENYFKKEFRCVKSEYGEDGEVTTG